MLPSERLPVLRRRGLLLAATSIFSGAFGYGFGTCLGWADERDARLSAQRELTVYATRATSSVADLERIVVELRGTLFSGNLPESAAPALRQVDFGLDATQLEFLSAAPLGSRTRCLLFEYARLTALADVHRQRVVGLLTGAPAESLRLLLDEAKHPRIVWAVEIQRNAQGFWGQLRPLSEPIPIGPPWPARLSVASAWWQTERYTQPGDAEGTLLPIDPSTLARPYAERVLRDILLETDALGLLIRGHRLGAPGLKSLGVSLGARARPD